MAEEGHRVTLHVYDLSQGLARQLSTTFLGKAIEAIWHTGIVVYGKEYFFGGGIQHAPAGSTQYGTPMKVVDLGITYLPQDVFESYLEEISDRYTAETYSLLSHNCNNFSNEVAQFLVGTSIPDYILQLPNEVMSSPMGAMILPMIQQLEATMKAGAVPQAPQFRPSSLGQAATGVTSSQSKSSNVYAKATESNSKSQEQSNKKEEANTSQKTLDKEVPPAVQPTGAQETSADPAEDPLGDARGKVQEEITREFAALMATGTLRASEAAALATRKVMERYGKLNVAMS
ncbi:desumoylating isopeptidase 1-like [Chenopodium quinoa]|uniref:PPPDE domain-containing protein n=1 Tax=Chenopodium quinoa TaxID=63459 RepID=A0A803LAL6_CHEQI|nr:desumoylating isopeptidase 1-like [Chenopodium quinoa]